MSLLSFTRCFIGAGGEQAATALTTAMVKMAPETATAAELKNMEQDLDAAGQLISRLQRELTDERHAYDAINVRYTQMMGAAENLQHQIDTASFLKDPLQASLGTLVAQIEEMVPELDQDKKDINSTQALLTEAEAAYRAKASALTGAKAKLTRAKNDMAHATLEEQRAASRAETARAVAGLSSGSGSGINVALDAMTRTARATRDRAAALDMKAEALSGAKTAEEDRTSPRQWRRLPERLQMLRSPTGWRLCNGPKHRIFESARSERKILFGGAHQVRAARRTIIVTRRTDGSNPAPSSAESCANPTSYEVDFPHPYARAGAVLRPLCPSLLPLRKMPSRPAQ